jgi:hypothetical protein
MARAQQTTALLTGIAAILASSASANQVRSFVGYASDPRSGERLYTETHEEIVGVDGSGELSTIYTTPDGDTIAVRTVDFSVDPVAPVFHFEDMRTGYREGALRVDNEVVLYRSPPRKTAVEQVVTEPSRQLVVDAGFDRLVAANWDRLVAGEPLLADFAVPSRLTCLTIQVEKTEDGVLDGEPVVTFRMRFKNPLLKLLAGPIDVTYHRDERFLMRYEGLSNVRDSRGNNYTVRIDFPIAERSTLAPGENANRRAAHNG